MKLFDVPSLASKTLPSCRSGTPPYSMHRELGKFLSTSASERLMESNTSVSAAPHRRGGAHRFFSK